MLDIGDRVSAYRIAVYGERERERERVQQIVKGKVTVSIDLKQRTAQLSNRAASDDSSKQRELGMVGKLVFLQGTYVPCS